LRQPRAARLVPELAKIATVVVVGTPGIEQPLPARAAYWNGRRVLGFVMTGVGLVAAGVGGVLPWQAKATYDTATGELGTSQYNDSQTAVTLGNVATGTLAASGALAVLGLIVWLTAPSAHIRTTGTGLVMVREF
jgi:hypothetical protein